MPQVQDLRISFNNISGTLPAEWGRLGAFQRLNRLWLSTNQLTGEHVINTGASHGRGLPYVQEHPSPDAAQIGWWCIHADCVYSSHSGDFINAA